MRISNLIYNRIYIYIKSFQSLGYIGRQHAHLLKLGILIPTYMLPPNILGSIFQENKIVYIYLYLYIQSSDKILKKLKERQRREKGNVI